MIGCHGGAGYGTFFLGAITLGVGYMISAYACKQDECKRCGKIVGTIIMLIAVIGMSCATWTKFGCSKNGCSRHSDRAACHEKKHSSEHSGKGVIENTGEAESSE